MAENKKDSINETEEKKENVKKTEQKKKGNNKKRNIIVWLCVFLIISGFIGYYVYSTETEKTKEKESPTAKYENLLEMDYEVVDVKDNSDKTTFIVKGAFRDSDIITYQNKLINIVDKKDFDVYYYENSASNYEFNGGNTPDFIAYTETDFNDFKMKFNKYQEVPNIEKAKILNKYNTGTIETIDDTLHISMEMDLDTGDYTSIVSNAKAFIDLFKRTNPEKQIENMSLHLIADDTFSYVYNTKEPNYLMVQEVKTFSKK